MSPSDTEAPVVTVGSVPSAAEYREAAARLTGMAENLHRQAALLSGWSLASQVGSGLIAAAVADRLARATGDLSAAGDEIARVARICSDRADVCTLYSQAVIAWRGRPHLERGPFPEQPYPWVPA